jgi:hypothetical protein
MRTILLLLSIHIGLTAFGQDRCATSDYSDVQKNANPLEAKKISEAENFIQKSSSSQYRTVGPAILKIPVVVHVLYKNAAQNISDAQIKSQIDALNRDFRRGNNDTSNTPQRFQSIAADMQIEFFLATADPKGRATNGIVRKYSNISNWIANDKIKFSAQGGDDAWDSKSYLNIWIGNLVAGAGYSSMPGSDANKDGIVINTGAFGTINVSGNYNLGRTATHEVGHWLGLKHIWGDAQCGDDLVGDTPQQGRFTQGCPTSFQSSCSNGELGDMYMNFMDYTADACMNLFTEGQKRRMHSVFAEGGPRAALLHSKGLKEPWLEESPLAESNTKILVYPNPARDELTISLDAEWIGKTIAIINVNGSLVQNIQIKSAIQKLNLSSLKAGLYFIKGEGLTQKVIKL